MAVSTISVGTRSVSSTSSTIPWPSCSASYGEAPMEFELKTLSREAVARTVAKAERYRLLNGPGEAESICRDALHVDPDNQEALVMLLLAMTDQFNEEPSAVDDA